MTALCAEVQGSPDAPALLLCGSLGSTMAMWDPQLPALRDRFHVIRCDTRGHGCSPVPPGPYTIADLGRDVVALLDRFGLERASLCGLSLGGMVALWVAAHAPERVDRLVVCCSSARLGPARMWTDRAATVRSAGTEAVAETVVSRWFTAGFAARNPELVAAMRRMVSDTPAEGYAGCCEAIAAMDLTPALAAVRAPTLVLAGADDPATPPEHARAIAAGIAGARVAVVEQAAHLANVEQPGRVTALLLDHLTAASDAGER